jgi:hypothetical protein
LEVLDTGGLILLPFVLQLASSVSHIRLNIEDDDDDQYNLSELDEEIDRVGRTSWSCRLPRSTVRLLTIEQFGKGNSFVDFFTTWPIQPIQISVPYDAAKWQGGMYRWTGLILSLASWPGFKRFEMLASDDSMGLIYGTICEHPGFIRTLQETWAGRGIRMKMHVLVTDWQDILETFGRETELDDVLYVVSV